MRVTTIGRVFSLGLLLVSSTVASLAGVAESVHQLNEDNFDEKVSRGLWLVEHFSPGCGHCRAFAPTYEKLAQEHKHLENTRGFHLAQINCQAQGDLCNKHDIKFYPQIQLYEDGKESEKFTGDRSYETLAKFIDSQSKRYIRSLGAPRDDPSGQSVMSSTAGVNLDGIAEEVDQTRLQQLKEGGPVFVKFYAPWCGHCKKLAPTWSELAGLMKNKLNVVAVNCDAHPRLCTAEGIKGYPTLKMFNQGTQKEYNKGRNIKSMQEFAEKYVTPGEIKHLDSEQWPKLRQQHDPYFVVLQTFSSKPSDLATVKTAAGPYLVTSSFYETHDPEIIDAANPHDAHGSVLAVFKDGSTLPTARLQLPVSAEQITSFILAQRHPTVIELDSSNFDEVIHSPTRALVVLVALKKTGRAAGELEKEVEELRKTAKAWYKGGRPFQQPVWFAWIDGERHRKWLKQNYGIKHTQMPAVVLADPATNQYYDTTLERSRLIFEGSSIFSTLEGAYQHFLKPKTSESTLEWGSKGLTNILASVVHAGLRHPSMAVFIFVGIIGGLAYALHRSIQADMRQAGSSRLD
ncbi:hypothetical protein NCC49_001751 [Naganishia albida]|nr:hypothetical protein NCC49_001751 [Naganishia albida]